MATVVTQSHPASLDRVLLRSHSRIVAAGAVDDDSAGVLADHCHPERAACVSRLSLARHACESKDPLFHLLLFLYTCCSLFPVPSSLFPLPCSSAATLVPTLLHRSD